jgi:hypothetical protein
MAEVNSSMIYLIYCKNFYKCHMYPQHNNKKRKKSHLKAELKETQLTF